uniref:SUZ domain-containing protein n=1 Tax=Heterorhabditis bacteriophora TaxID=37862 RepID=A0A1I7XK15_HETBA
MSSNDSLGGSHRETPFGVDTLQQGSDIQDNESVINMTSGMTMKRDEVGGAIQQPPHTHMIPQGSIPIQGQVLVDPTTGQHYIVPQAAFYQPVQPMFYPQPTHMYYPYGQPIGPQGFVIPPNGQTHSQSHYPVQVASYQHPQRHFNTTPYRIQGYPQSVASNEDVSRRDMEERRFGKIYKRSYCNVIYAYMLNIAVKSIIQLFAIIIQQTILLLHHHHFLRVLFLQPCFLLIHMEILLHQRLLSNIVNKTTNVAVQIVNQMIQKEAGMDLGAIFLDQVLSLLVLLLLLNLLVKEVGNFRARMKILYIMEVVKLIDKLKGRHFMAVLLHGGEEHVSRLEIHLPMLRAATRAVRMDIDLSKPLLDEEKTEKPKVVPRVPGTAFTVTFDSPVEEVSLQDAARKSAQARRILSRRSGIGNVGSNAAGVDKKDTGLPPGEQTANKSYLLNKLLHGVNVSASETDAGILEVVERKDNDVISEAGTYIVAHFSSSSHAARFSKTSPPSLINPLPQALNKRISLGSTPTNRSVLAASHQTATTGSNAGNNTPFRRNDGGRFSMRGVTAGPSSPQQLPKKPPFRTGGSSSKPFVVITYMLKYFPDFVLADLSEISINFESDRGDQFVSNRSISFHVGPAAMKSPTSNLDLLRNRSQESLAQEGADQASQKVLAEYSRGVVKNLNRLSQQSSRASGKQLTGLARAVDVLSQKCKKSIELIRSQSPFLIYLEQYSLDGNQSPIPTFSEEFPDSNSVASEFSSLSLRSRPSTESSFNGQFNGSIAATSRPLRTSAYRSKVLDRNIIGKQPKSN